jgi:hypothetical protein
MPFAQAFTTKQGLWEQSLKVLWIKHFYARELFWRRFARINHNPRPPVSTNMLDRIATAELQLEPTPSPAALRTRRWREKKAEEDGTAGNPAPTEQNTSKFNGDSDDDAENSAPGSDSAQPETSPCVKPNLWRSVTRPRQTRQPTRPSIGKPMLAISFNTNAMTLPSITTSEARSWFGAAPTGRMSKMTLSLK